MSLEKIEAALKHYLDEEELQYDSQDGDEGGSILYFLLDTPIKFAPTLFYNLIADQDSFYIYASYPEPADKCLPAMAEFIARVNFGLKLGNFELDYEGGEVRYKAFVALEENQVPSYDLIDNAFNMPLAMFYKYAGGIAAVMSGELTPEEAAAVCELDDEGFEVSES